jgi:hypothetical protein
MQFSYQSNFHFSILWMPLITLYARIFPTDGAPVFYPILKLANQKPTDII